jgi:hypothetical protein
MAATSLKSYQLLSLPSLSSSSFIDVPNMLSQQQNASSISPLISHNETSLSEDVSQPMHIDCLPSTSSTNQGQNPETGDSVRQACAVCGDTGAVAKHYGVLACLGLL